MLRRKFIKPAHSSCHHYPNQARGIPNDANKLGGKEKEKETGTTKLGKKYTIDATPKEKNPTPGI